MIIWKEKSSRWRTPPLWVLLAVLGILVVALAFVSIFKAASRDSIATTQSLPKAAHTEPKTPEKPEAPSVPLRISLQTHAVRPGSSKIPVEIATTGTGPTSLDQIFQGSGPSAPALSVVVSPKEAGDTEGRFTWSEAKKAWVGTLTARDQHTEKALILEATLQKGGKALAYGKREIPLSIRLSGRTVDSNDRKIESNGSIIFYSSEGMDGKFPEKFTAEVKEGEFTAEVWPGKVSYSPDVLGYQFYNSGILSFYEDKELFVKLVSLDEPPLPLKGNDVVSGGWSQGSDQLDRLVQAYTVQGQRGVTRDQLAVDSLNGLVVIEKRPLYGWYQVNFVDPVSESLLYSGVRNYDGQMGTLVLWHGVPTLFDDKCLNVLVPVPPPPVSPTPTETPVPTQTSTPVPPTEVPEVPTAVPTAPPPPPPGPTEAPSTETPGPTATPLPLEETPTPGPTETVLPPLPTGMPATPTPINIQPPGPSRTAVIQTPVVPTPLPTPVATPQPVPTVSPSGRPTPPPPPTVPPAQPTKPPVKR